VEWNNIPLHLRPSAEKVVVVRWTVLTK
jgi:hypothetical protein